MADSRVVLVTGAAGGIDSAARRKRHDEAHETRGIDLGGRRAHERRRRDGGRAKRDEAAAVHGRFPVFVLELKQRPPVAAR